MAATGTDSFPAFHHSSDQSVTTSHTAVGYLFGGLASMMGLIALALLILACSYLKLSGHVADESTGDGNNSGDHDLETGEKKINKLAKFDEKILVIMAGDEKPTFIATPITRRGTSCGSYGLTITDEEKQREGDRLTERTKEGRADQVGTQTLESHVVSDHHSP